MMTITIKFLLVIIKSINNSKSKTHSKISKDDILFEMY